MIVLNALFPAFFLIFLGVALKRAGITDEAYLRQSDRLIYYIFFPVMLFWKIGGASFGGIDWTFCLVTLLILALLFVISTIVIRAVPISHFQAGSFSQSCYRFNTYIGVAVILNSLGAEGVALFGILISLAIPLINVFAVSTLIYHSPKQSDSGHRAKQFGRALAANPLILGCIAGIAYAKLIGEFPVFIDNSLSLASMFTLPMALLSIGGSLSFAGIQKNLKTSLLASGLKLVLMPLMGYAGYRLAGVDGIAFRVGMIFFCLPVSTTIYVLSSQMHSDTELASSAIVVSTMLSFVSLSVALLI